MLQGGGAYPAAQAGEMLNLVAAYSANPLDPQWLMETLGLTEAAKTTYRRLSGGQQQRLALACAVVGRPELVFLDEPTAGMDAHARIVVWELIDALRSDGVTVVLTTSADRSRGTGRPAGDHRPRRCGGQRDTAELMRSGAEKLRFGRRGCWICRCWSRRCRKLQSHRDLSGRPGRRTDRPAGAGDGDGVVRAAQCAATDMRVEQRSLEDVFLDLTGRGCGRESVHVRNVHARSAAGDGAEDAHRAVRTRTEAVVAQRRTAAAHPVHPDHSADRVDAAAVRVVRVQPGGDVRAAIMSLAVISTAFTGQAIAVAFDRRYGALKRIGATALAGVGHHRRQVAGRRHRGFSSVNRVGRHRLCAGVAAAHRGPDAGRSHHRARHRRVHRDGVVARRHAARRDRAAVANLLWFVFAGLGALTLEGQAVPKAVRWVNSRRQALTEALTQAMSLSVDWFGFAVLAVWGAVSALCALRWFRYT